MEGEEEAEEVRSLAPSFQVLDRPCIVFPGCQRAVTESRTKHRNEDLAKITENHGKPQTCLFQSLLNPALIDSAVKAPFAMDVKGKINFSLLSMVSLKQMNLKSQLEV